MTDKAKVVIECAGHERSYEVAPGETLVVEASHYASVRFRPAKGPQPEGKWYGSRFRLDDKVLMSYELWRGEWVPVPETPAQPWNRRSDWLRMVADLKDATEKWHAA